MRAVRAAFGGAAQRIVGQARRQTGGPARLRVVVLFAAVYALANADTGTVGAVAPQLQSSLHVSNTQIGLIAAVAALAGAVGTIPAGVLTDRVRRIDLLAASIVLWSAAMVASALAPSFLVLVLTRIGLGAVTATSGPTVASLTGDFFPARERARILGLIMTGELVGAGIGVVVGGDLAGLTSWRYGFAWLAIPGLALAVAIRRGLVEPARGGQSRLEPGATELIDDADVDDPGADAAVEPPDSSEQEQTEQVRRIVRRRHVEPDPQLVLHESPKQMPLPAAVRYVLRIRTNVFLIVSAALAYVFFSGVQTFSVLLMRSRYHLGESAATGLLVLIGIGALAGLVVAGQLADRWLARGRLDARVLIGAIAYLVAAVAFAPGLLSTMLLVSLPLMMIGAAGLAAPDATLNAARLDIMHPYLWGRAEGVRTSLHMLTFAIAPLLFGFVSDQLGGGHAGFAFASGRGAATAADGRALAYTFLIMLACVAVAGLILLRARHTYPRDVATAIASAQATADEDPGT
ncbi:MAG TPA: MFS transporter [Solirubrobacteraceae bacterium]|nr:MFS transporter [Solirubrobacteraceae bacterium]